MGNSESCDLHFEYSSDWTWPSFSWESALTQDSWFYFTLTHVSAKSDWDLYKLPMNKIKWLKHTDLLFTHRNQSYKEGLWCFYHYGQGSPFWARMLWTRQKLVGVHLLDPLSNSIEQTRPCCSWQGWLPLSLCEGRCSTSNNTDLDLSNTEKNVNETKQLW